MLEDIDNLAWKYLTIIHNCYYELRDPRPLKTKIVYINGVDQISEGWYPSGNIESRYDYIKGEFKEWHEDGQLSRSWYEVNEMKEGLHKEWWSDGSKKAELSYKNGKPEGIELQWYMNGKLANKKSILMGKDGVYPLATSRMDLNKEVFI